MGADKTLLEISIDGVHISLPALAAKKLATVCQDVAVADCGRSLVPGLPSLPDGPGQGPAAGILGAAAVYPGRPLLVLACDLPRVPAELLKELARPENVDWVVPRWNDRVEPLCALYGPAALAVLADRVRQGFLAPHGLTDEPGLTVRYVEGKHLARFGLPEKVFFNLNRPEDLEKLRGSR